MIFSLWAGIALLIVNPYFKNNLPGYQIGTICIWEFAALVVAAAIAHFTILKWGSLDFKKVDGKNKLELHSNYAYFLLVYFFLAVIVAIWQFYEYSKNF